MHVSTGSGAVGMAHLDGSGVDECVMTMVQRVQELSMGYPEGRLELQLVGGYSDPRHYSEDLFYTIMRELIIIVFNIKVVQLLSYLYSLSIIGEK